LSGIDPSSTRPGGVRPALGFAATFSIAKFLISKIFSGRL
jgi:hypothetical protein